MSRNSSNGDKNRSQSNNNKQNGKQKDLWANQQVTRKQFASQILCGVANRNVKNS